MDHIGAAQLLRVQQPDHSVQFGKLRGLIHGIAGLDAEVVVAGSQLFENMGDIGHIIGLDVAQHEELLGRTGRADGEALRRLRPVVTGGHLIFIGRACGQASQRDAVHVYRVIAACNKGTQLRCRRSDGNPVLSPLHTVAQELFLRYRRIGQPGNVLRRVAALCGIEEERGLFDCHRIVGIDLIAHGQTAILCLGVDGDHAGGAERITGQRTVFTGRSQRRIVLLENRCVGYRLALQVCDRQDGIPIGEHRSAGHIDSRTHRQRHLGGGEGHQVAVHVVAHTGLDLVEERTAGRQAGGYSHPHRGDQVAVLDGTAAGTHGLDSDGVVFGFVAFGGVIVGCRGEIGGERHGAVTKLSIQTDDRVALADIAACTPDLQCHIAAHGSHGLHVGHTDGVFHAAVRHGKVTGLRGLITEAIAEGHRDRVGAIGKLQVIQVYVLIALVHIGLLRHIDTVHIETHGIVIYPSGILTGRVAEIGAQIEVTAVNRTAIDQLLVVEGNGVHLRIFDIIRIRAVHKLEVIQVDRPDPGFDHLCVIDKHETEGHILHQAERRIRCFKFGLAILPTLPVDAGLLTIRLFVRIDNGLWFKGVVKLDLVSVFIKCISPQPKAGICSVPLPCNADALRGIDPHAKACGNSRNRHIICSTYACALCYCSALAEVEVQLHRFRSEAHGLSIVNTDDLDRLISTSIIVKGVQNTVFTAIVILRRSGSAVLIDMILEVPHQCG